MLYAMAVWALLTGTSGAEAAQPMAQEVSRLKTVPVYYTQPGRRDLQEREAGHEVTYRFIVCEGEIHMAYSVGPGDGAITLVGDIRTHNGVVATLNDRFAGPALGFGCYTGQTLKIGSVRSLVARQNNAQDFMQQLYFVPRPIYRD